MEPTFIYYNNLTFDDEKKFSIDFSDEDSLEGVYYITGCILYDYYITSMTCYVDLTGDITKLVNYTKIKQTSDLGTAILRGGVDFGYGKKGLMLGKTSRSNLIFQSDKSIRDQYLENVEFFDIENKKPKELKDKGLKSLTTDRNNPIKSYTVKLSNDLKFLTRFLNDINKNFIEQYTKNFDIVIFIRDVSRKSGYIPFKFDLTK